MRSSRSTGCASLSLKDPLTGLANRRHFRAVLEREIDRVTRSGEAALLLMLDIDHFKQVNDVPTATWPVTGCCNRWRAP
jgi:PleD family two-component response regulator